MPEPDPPELTPLQQAMLEELQIALFLGRMEFETEMRAQVAQFYCRIARLN